MVPPYPTPFLHPIARELPKDTDFLLLSGKPGLDITGQRFLSPVTVLENSAEQRGLLLLQHQDWHPNPLLQLTRKIPYLEQGIKRVKGSLLHGIAERGWGNKLP